MMYVIMFDIDTGCLKKRFSIRTHDVPVSTIVSTIVSK